MIGKILLDPAPTVGWTGGDLHGLLQCYVFRRQRYLRPRERDRVDHERFEVHGQDLGAFGSADVEAIGPKRDRDLLAEHAWRRTDDAAGVCDAQHALGAREAVEDRTHARIRTTDPEGYALSVDGQIRSQAAQVLPALMRERPRAIACRFVWRASASVGARVKPERPDVFDIRGPD